MTPLVVGNTVRISCKVSVVSSNGRKTTSNNDEYSTRILSRRAIVATLPEEGNANGICSLVQDDLAPRPLVHGTRKFLVAPMFTSVGVEECEMDTSDVRELLPFEQAEFGEGGGGNVDLQDDSILSRVEQYKGYGDELLRLGDYTCAISYYEAALGLVSSKFDNVGGSLLIRRNGHSVIAEVDCIDDDGTYDVTYILPNGETEEGTMKQTDILMAVWPYDQRLELFLQPRILLNLCRCLLRLAEIDGCIREKSSASKKDRKEKYRQAAVLGCSCAITLCEYYIADNSAAEQSVSSLLEKARIVRARAFLDLGKVSCAILLEYKRLHSFAHLRLPIQR